MNQWMYGVTTCAKRASTLLPKTLASLAAAGFDKPHLFVDGGGAAGAATVRNPPVRTAGNWMLSMYELYYRNAFADRYAIFQDDAIFVRNLRSYLDSCAYRERCYWNLYTAPSNEAVRNGRNGWYESNQLGKGAVALVFSRDAVQALLSERHMVYRVTDEQRGWQAIDGGIVTAMGNQGYKELVHGPSLCQHIGQESSMGHGLQPLALSFPGEVEVR